MGAGTSRAERRRARHWAAVALAAGALALPLGGCGQEGPAERAGEKIDDAVESAQEGVEDAVNPPGPAERAGEKIDEAVDEAKDMASDAAEAVEEKAEEARESM